MFDDKLRYLEVSPCFLSDFDLGDPAQVESGRGCRDDCIFLTVGVSQIPADFAAIWDALPRKRGHPDTDRAAFG
jgi:hypothetical protein